MNSPQFQRRAAGGGGTIKQRKVSQVVADYLTVLGQNYSSGSSSSNFSTVGDAWRCNRARLSDSDPIRGSLDQAAVATLHYVRFQFEISVVTITIT